MGVGGPACLCRPLCPARHGFIAAGGRPRRPCSRRCFCIAQLHCADIFRCRVQSPAAACAAAARAGVPSPSPTDRLRSARCALPAEQVANALVNTSTPAPLLKGKVVSNGFINLEKLLVWAVNRGKELAAQEAAGR